MKLLVLSLSGAIALTIIGCSTLPNIEVAELEDEQRPAKSGPLDIYASEEAVTNDFYEFLDFRWVGNHGLDEAALASFRKAALEKGADGLIVHPSDRHISFEGGTQVTRTIYSATAIVYED